MTDLLEVVGVATGAIGGGAALYLVIARPSARRRTLADEVLRRMESECGDGNTGPMEDA